MNAIINNLRASLPVHFAAVLLALVALAGGCADETQRVALEQQAELETLTAINQLWFTTDEGIAGVYYDLVDGTCPHGGALSEQGCMLTTLNPSVEYWIDASTAAGPGVFYQPVGGVCSHGGLMSESGCKVAPILDNLLPLENALAQNTPATN